MTQNYPVTLGNVTVIDGNPSQQALENFANGLAPKDEVNAAIAVFKAVLEEAGRGGSAKAVAVHYGPHLIDLVTAGIRCLPVPWHWQHWYKDRSDKLPMFEAHGWSEGSGWYAEVRPGVMLHARFDGDEGLTSHEVAAALAGCKDPASSLVSWFEEALDRNVEYPVEGLLPHLPDELKEHLSFEFHQGKRTAYISVGEDESRVFSFRETPVNFRPDV